MLVNCIEHLVKSIQIEQDARRDNTRPTREASKGVIVAASR